MANYSIAIHGGAGTILKGLMTPEKEEQYKQALREAIGAGEKILSKGGTSTDAVEAAVLVLEDNELFNAGKGSVFTANGKHEMDAAIMNGKTLECGAVAGVSGIKNPVKLAKCVMEKSEHVLLSGSGAMEFAKEMHLELKDENYFFSQARYDQYKLAQQENKIVLDHTGETNEKKFGTVGAVALDIHGNLAAATSTGGMTNKKFGRIGDSPIIGAGTYANNNTCAISCTGHGELFIRSIVAYDVSCLMEYKGFTLQQACEKVVLDKLVKISGEGGLIAIDKNGNIQMPFNSEGMYRACKTNNSELFVGIYGTV